MKPLRWILLLGCTFVALSGCDYPDEVRLFFTETDEQMIPYRKGENVRFIDEQGNLSTLVVSEDATIWKRDEEGFTRFMWQHRNVRLSSGQNDLQFDLKVESNNDFYQFSNVRVQTSAGGDFRVNYDLLGLRETQDSLEINHHVYYDVAVVKDRKGKGSQLWYNTDYGILQVMQDGKNIFTLVP